MACSGQVMTVRLFSRSYLWSPCYTLHAPCCVHDLHVPWALTQQAWTKRNLVLGLQLSLTSGISGLGLGLGSGLGKWAPIKLQQHAYWLRLFLVITTNPACNPRLSGASSYLATGNQSECAWLCLGPHSCMYQGVCPRPTGPPGPLHDRTRRAVSFSPICTATHVYFMGAAVRRGCQLQQSIS